MIIVKVGGGRALNLAGLAADMARLREPAVVVHGANALRDALAERLGIRLERVRSLSGVESVIADSESVQLMMMAYAGAANTRLVEQLQQHGVDAVGLSGVDGRLIEARRNPGIRTRANGKTVLRRDLSGKPKRINTRLLNLLLENGFLPVLTMPLIDELRCAVSSENDDVVALLQAELSAEQVVQLIEAPGLLHDPAEPSSLITSLDAVELAEQRAAASGRMARKLMAIERLLQQGTTRVVIADGRVDAPLVAAMAGHGTVIEP